MPNPTAHPRWPKLLLAAAAAIALLLGLLVFVLHLVFPPQRLASLLSAQVSSATGRNFTVRGALSIRLWPRIGIAAEDVVLGNAPWGSRQEMLAVKQARFDIALWPLLQGLVDIASVSLSGVDLWLETDRNGVGNWVMSTSGAASAGDGSSSHTPLRLALSHIALVDARLSYRDARGGAVRSLRVARLALDIAGDGHQLDAAFDSSGQLWQLSGQIGRLADLAANQADWPFDLRLASDGALLSAKGLLRRGPLPQSVQADFSASLTRAAALSPWLPAATRVPLPIELKGRLNYAPSALRIDGLQLSVAQQPLSGQLQAQGGRPWKIDVQLAAPLIDLSRWLPPRAAATAASAAAAGRSLFGTTPLGLDSLPAGPATLALRVDKLLVPGMPALSNLNAQLNAQPGRFKADRLSFGLAGGTLHGSVSVASAAGTPPRVALQAQGSNLSLDELLRASGHSAFAQGGTLQLRADLNLVGNTGDALAAGANGELLLSVVDTTLGGGLSPLGTDVLTRVLQAVTLQPKMPASSRVQCAVMRLPLRNGVATVDRSIALETEQLAVSAKGEIRFDHRTLSLAFHPSPKGGVELNPVNLAQLVVLKGPWANPELSLDAQGVVAMAATLGAAGATGGLSLLVQQLLKAAPEANVCRTALGGAAAAAPPVATKPPQSAPTLPQGLPQSLPQGVPEALRKIFK